MTPLADPVVEWSAVFHVVWASLLAGIGVTAAFALAILGATRAVEMRRDGHAVAAGAYLVLLALALAVVAGAVVFGIVVMTQK